MNKGRLILGIGLIVLAGSIFAVSSTADMQFFGMETGDQADNIITTTENVKEIHTIKADGIVNVHINVSDTESARFVFNDKRFKNKSTFTNGVLSIHLPTKVRGFSLFGFSNSGVDAYVTVKKLKHIQMNGIGTIESEHLLEVDDMKIINEGTGSINLELNAKSLIARNAGVGSINILGNADTADLSNQGVGSINAENFIVQYLDVSNDGVGSADVNAEQEIKIRNSGVGSVRYGGNAEVITQKSEGIGSISKN